MIRALYRRARRAINRARGKDIFFPEQIRVTRERHGNEYGGWWTAPGISAASIVYSVGIGKDISFDLSLIDRYGVTVHAFDPTPEAVEWVKAQALPSSFVLHEVGLAAYDGDATFFPPENSQHVSHTMIDRPQTADRAIRVPVRRLSTLMRELGHDHIDILKMDIEGAEYAVLEDVIRAGLPVHQVLVEFHHRFPGVGTAATRRAVGLLNQAGYRIFAAAASGEEYSFQRSSSF